MQVERLIDGWIWWLIAGRSWPRPLDPGFAQLRGGRWNRPASFPVLYFNEDMATARLNLRRFIERWPFEPEDLRSDNGPVLIGAALPRHQDVCDAHSPAGVRALGLARTFPHDRAGQLVAHARCQPIGDAVRSRGLRGVRARSAQSTDGAGRELAWFPATARSVARQTHRYAFDEWYWS